MGKFFFAGKNNKSKSIDGIKKEALSCIEAESERILEAFGGCGNICDISACTSILRVSVIDERLVDKDKIKATNSSGILLKGNRIQVIYGNRVREIVENLKQYLAEKTIPILSVDEKIVRVMERYDEQVECITAPVIGQVTKLTKVEDGVFSAGLMGKGVAILPIENNIYAPVSGRVTTIYDGKHTICFKAYSGVEVMVCIGVDTVTLNGKYFEILVDKNQEVTAGELIGHFNREAIKKAGYRLITSVVIINHDKYGRFNYITSGIITNESVIIEVKDKIEKNINRNLR